jgi:hypothetical protein
MCLFENIIYLMKNWFQSTSSPLPVCVVNRIEKLHCDFLWGRLGEKFKFHLLSLS